MRNTGSRESLDRKKFITTRVASKSYAEWRSLNMARYDSGMGIVCEGAVGLHGRNERGDVALVQYALLVLTRGFRRGNVNSHALRVKPGALVGWVKLEVPNQGRIAIDGDYGSQTAGFIRAYQALPHPNGEKVAPTGTLLSNNLNGIPGGTWNVGLLLADAAELYPVYSNSQFANYMRMDPECPQFLKSLLWRDA